MKTEGPTCILCSFTAYLYANMTCTLFLWSFKSFSLLFYCDSIACVLCALLNYFLVVCGAAVPAWLYQARFCWQVNLWITPVCIHPHILWRELCKGKKNKKTHKRTGRWPPICPSYLCQHIETSSGLQHSPLGSRQKMTMKLAYWDIRGVSFSAALPLRDKCAWISQAFLIIFHER